MRLYLQKECERLLFYDSQLNGEPFRGVLEFIHNLHWRWKDYTSFLNFVINPLCILLDLEPGRNVSYFGLIAELLYTTISFLEYHPLGPSHTDRVNRLFERIEEVVFLNIDPESQKRLERVPRDPNKEVYCIMEDCSNGWLPITYGMLIHHILQAHIVENK
ncbi:hypothetical protein P171DRAFT_481474 [Karstenula rhodostoma CBS 690.94]|uniref:Uncharacterized protein n=1 Tax=Karstenula rhodostoma CBS 690.94 TaxID=1392251 RepID=A0A9P4PT92_9PLEO|nr:hypothetical protein P171DRAFT_481474 [Karstenula rhodostoma CBS 690.94]